MLQHSHSSVHNRIFSFCSRCFCSSINKLQISLSLGWQTKPKLKEKSHNACDAARHLTVLRTAFIVRAPQRYFAVSQQTLHTTLSAKHFTPLCIHGPPFIRNENSLICCEPTLTCGQCEKYSAKTTTGQNICKWSWLAKQQQNCIAIDCFKDLSAMQR